MIYRIVGRDERPGDAGLASSETFFIEVAGPGQVALAGFELPPDRERYALSQQMIVLKLERLRAREKTLDRATLEQEVGEHRRRAARRAGELRVPDGRAGRGRRGRGRALARDPGRPAREHRAARDRRCHSAHGKGRDRPGRHQHERLRCRPRAPRSRRCSGPSAGTATFSGRLPCAAASIRRGG